MLLSRTWRKHSLDGGMPAMVRALLNSLSLIIVIISPLKMLDFTEIEGSLV